MYDHSNIFGKGSNIYPEMIYLERGYFSFQENHALWSFNKHTRHGNSVKYRPDKVIRLNNPLRYVMQ